MKVVIKVVKVVIVLGEGVVEVGRIGRNIGGVVYEMVVEGSGLMEVIGSWLWVIGKWLLRRVI